ncbi:glycosyltransferase family 2 protein [Polynucleobacter paneuropaeus]|nr:glycosyltransferase family 2 protein [Polynucleobacter paneuropaeus]MBT8533711.1 glycosyltransferase family 2 protein [Polynucleobacter paneuropaeus]
MNKGIIEGLVLIIPAFNEEAAIGGVVTSCRKMAEVIVVDDGSTDSTALVAESFGAHVLRHQINLGYDGALESGLKEALKKGYQYAITLDGDGQHDVSCIRDIHKKLVSGAYIVCGLRDKKQRILEIIFGVVGKILFNVSDPLCGIKGYRLSKALFDGEFNTYKSTGTELLFKAKNKKLEILEIAIKTQPRLSGVTRFGSGFVGNLKLAKSLILGLIN